MDGVSSYSRVLRRRKLAPKKYKKRAYVKYGTTKSRKPYKLQKRAALSYRKAKRAKHTIPVMSKCAVDYLKSQYDPWNMKSSPCIPDLIMLPSFKFSTRIRGVFQTNGSGFGMISMNPYVPSNTLHSGALANKNFLAPVWYTDANYVGTVTGINDCTDAAIPSPVGMVPAYWNSQITSDAVQTAVDDFTESVVWRPVGGGIKVKYSGRLEDRSGNYIMWTDPTNNDILGRQGLLTVQLLQREETEYTVVADDEVAVLYHQRNENDLRYSDDYYQTQPAAPLDNANDLAKYHTLAIVVNGSVDSAYTFDCVMHWEAVGSQFPSRTASHADPTGFAAVQNTFPTRPPKTPPSKTVSEKIVEVGVNIAGNMAHQYGNSFAPGVGDIANQTIHTIFGSN